MEKEIEKLTPGKFLLKIRLEKMTYTVFFENKPEIPSDTTEKSIVCRLPHIVFIGENFDIRHYSPGINYVKVDRKRMLIPYRYGYQKNIRNLSIYTGSNSDLLPVKVSQFMNAKELMEFLQITNHKIIVIIDEDFQRLDLVQMKIKFPKLQIMIVKDIIPVDDKAEEEPEEVEDDNVIDDKKMRAVDTINERNINVLSKNPVFLSRVHLRTLDLDKVKQILFDFRLSKEDCEFIASFLATMIKKDSESLNKVKPKLIALKEAYDVYPYIMNRDKDQVEKVLDQKIPRDAASIIWKLILTEKKDAKKKEDKLLLWEWEEKIKVNM
jgi:hypothetical protein